jgi:putative tricarboxylic transport membrane protein
MESKPTMEAETPRRGGLDLAALAVAAVLMALAGLLLWDAAQLGGGPAYARVGPGTATKLVAAGLGALGILTGLMAVRGGFLEPEPYNLSHVLQIVAGFAATIAIIALGGGFILAMTVLFAATAWAFGRRAPVTDFAVGFALALGAYLAFTRLLTLSLPAGPLERLF